MTLARVARFGLVGLVNTAVYYGLYLGLRLVVPYFVAHLVAFVLSMIGSFFLNCYYTFRQPPTWRRFLLFPLSNLTNFVVTSVGLFLLVNYAGMNDKLAPIVAASVAVPITFVVAKLILVGRESDGDDEPVKLPGAAP
jgi:putative flippase GtrA